MDAVDLKDPDLRLQTGEQRLQAAVVRPLRQHMVERAIDREPALLGTFQAVHDLLATLLDGALRLVQFLVGQVRQRQAQGQHLQYRADVVDLAYILAGERGDKEATAALGAHDAILRKPVQRLAYGGAADSQLLAQAQIRDLVAWVEPAADKLLPDDRVDLVAQGCMLDLIHSSNYQRPTQSDA